VPIPGRREVAIVLMLFRKLLLFVAILVLLIAVPVSAHDLPMGGSRWCFGKNKIIANIDLRMSALAEIKGIKEGHYDLDSLSDKQLQQIAAEILQPYINKKLSITVDNKRYPVKVDKVVRNANNLYTIWLSIDNVSFNSPVNPVRIDYTLLFEETKNAHVNIAYGYLSDATGDALQKIFDFSPAALQKTFDYKAPVWEFSINGPANVPAPKDKAGRLVVSGSAENLKDTAAYKNTAGTPRTSATAPKSAVPSKQTSGATVADSPIQSMQVSTAQGKDNSSISYNSAKPSMWTTIGEFLLMGIEHILTGYDHIAFLLALIVIGLSIREVLKIITAFTIAHSITLLLAALEIVKLNARFVESVIAFSICYVALENLFRKKVNYRWLIAGGFGLVHGFGFASALQELIVGKSDLLLSVISFNVGVEMGQLMIFFVMLPILYLLKKQFDSRIITAGTSVAIFMIGFAWLIERVFTVQLLWF
jgi:hydrogenase/urease accessory protein HupE